jgi:hypothetical protein
MMNELTDEQRRLMEVCLETLTVEQFYQICSRVHDVCLAGYGEVHIVIQNGHPCFVTSLISDKLAAPAEK